MGVEVGFWKIQFGAIGSFNNGVALLKSQSVTSKFVYKFSGQAASLGVGPCAHPGLRERCYGR